MCYTPSIMRNFARIALFVFLITAGVITINQAYNFRTDAEEPITSPITSQETPTPTPTEEVTPTPTPQNQSNNEPNNSNNSGSSNSNSSASAPSCGDGKPGNAPQISSIRRTGVKQLTVMWNKANDPVTYYLIAYGTKPGRYEYATPQTGDSNTTSYTINELSPNQTYYFSIRGGNGCMPGDYSPEALGKVSGRIGSSTLGIATKQKISVSGAGASPKVYNIKKEIVPIENPIVPEPRVQTTTHSTGLFQKISSFFKSLFK